MSNKKCKNCKHKKEGKYFTYCGALGEDYLRYLYNEEDMDYLWLEISDDTGVDTLVLKVTDNFGCAWFEWK